MNIKKPLNIRLSTYKKGANLFKTELFFKKPRTVLQTRLNCCHWSFFEISVMKHVSVLRQKPTHVLL